MGEGLSRAGLPSDRLLLEASLWSADHARFAEDMRRVEPFIDLFHVDVSDDHFVPGLLLFPDLVGTLRRHAGRPIHVHLMVERPARLVEPFVAAGADLVTVHAECGRQAHDALEDLERRNVATGIALRLDSPIELLDPFLARVRIVLLMGTEVGVKGVDLAAGALERIRRVGALLLERGLRDRVRVEADGGIRRHTVGALCGAGADVLVMGSLLFGSDDPAGTTAWVRSLRPAPGP